MEAARRDLSVEVITHLPAAQRRWEVLQSQGAATPFQSYAWVTTLAQTVGRSVSAETFVIIVRDDGGRDMMLLPLVRRSFGPARLIEAPDFGVSDYAAPIIASDIVARPERLAAIWQAALSALPSAQVIRLNKIPEELGQSPNPMLHLGGLWPKDTQSWRVVLPEQWSLYESLALTTKVRGDLRRRLRNLGQVGPVAYTTAQDEPAAKEIFDTLCAHREVRFARLGRRDILGEAPYRQFYWQLIKDGLATGFVSLSALKLGSDIVAALLGLRWRDGYVALIPTMSESESLQKHGLGKLMNWLQIKEMHARGCRCFDFSIGDEPYKRDFGAKPRRLYETVLPLKIQASPLAWSFKLRAGVRRWRKKPAAA